jgi:MFS family permease
LGGYRAARVLIFAQISSIIKQFQMGLAYGVTETLNSFAIMLSPLLAGWFYTQNPESVFIVAFGLVVVSIIASMIVTPRILPDPVIETE